MLKENNGLQFVDKNHSIYFKYFTVMPCENKAS